MICHTIKFTTSGVLALMQLYKFNKLKKYLHNTGSHVTTQFNKQILNTVLALELKHISIVEYFLYSVI